jgi:hypothetical protein
MFQNYFILTKRRRRRRSEGPDDEPSGLPNLVGERCHRPGALDVYAHVRGLHVAVEARHPECVRPARRDSLRKAGGLEFDGRGELLVRQDAFRVVFTEILVQLLALEKEGDTASPGHYEKGTKIYL